MPNTSHSSTFVAIAVCAHKNGTETCCLWRGDSLNGNMEMALIRTTLLSSNCIFTHARTHTYHSIILTSTALNIINNTKYQLYSQRMLHL